MPARLFTGKGCVLSHASDIAYFGDRCLIVTGRSAAKKSGALDDVIKALEKTCVSYEIFDGIGSNPAIEKCMEAAEKARAFNAQFIIGIGGGSPLDAAKATAVFAANEGLDEKIFYSKNWPDIPLPVVLVGTTAGTGSEVTKVSVLTDSLKKKHSIHDDAIFASLSLGDPSYTMTLPLKVTLSTGIDILAHCAESYFNKNANDISRATAISGIKLLYEPLMKAQSGKELLFDDREALYNASILGGLSINITGTCFPHNMGYYLTETLGVPHGFASAAFFPQLLEHVKIQLPDVFNKFISSINLSEKQLLALCEKCLEGIEIKLDNVELEKALPRWANNNSVNNTLGEVTLEDVKKWFEKYL